MVKIRVHTTKYSILKDSWIAITMEIKYHGIRKSSIRNKSMEFGYQYYYKKKKNPSEVKLTFIKEASKKSKVWKS